MEHLGRWSYFDYGWHQTLEISFSVSYLRVRQVVLGCSPEDHSSLENIGQRLSEACLHCGLRRVAVLLLIGSSDFLEMDTTAQYLNSRVDEGLEQYSLLDFVFAINLWNSTVQAERPNFQFVL